MIGECVQYFKRNYPKFYNILKRNAWLHYFYYLPSKMYMDGRKKAIQLQGYDVIGMVYRISKELKIDIWIDGGTLLGYVREGELLKHDYDIDFGAYSLHETDRERLIKALENNGCTLVRGVSDKKIQYSDSFEYMGAMFDLNYYFPSGDRYYYYIHDVNVEHGSRVIKNKCKNFKMTHIQGYDRYKCIYRDNGVKEGEFSNGCPCIIPHNPIKRIEEIYGMDWRIPIIQNYDWRKDSIVQYLGFYEDLTGWIIK